MPKENKLCIVAGAGPGMGSAIARRFARERYDVALLARNAAAVETAAEALRTSGVRSIGVSVDLTDLADIARAFNHVRSTLGDANVLVYNAARWLEIAAMNIDPATFTAELSLSITGALACAQQVYPAMRAAGSGSLLFTGGGLALYPQHGSGVSSLTVGKAGLRALVLALQGELASESIRVGTVTIAGTVAAGTPFDPDRIAQAYWDLHANP